MVDEIVEGYEELELDYPTGEGESRLSQALKTTCLWRKELIKLPNWTSPTPPARDDQVPRPSLPPSSPPSFPWPGASHYPASSPSASIACAGASHQSACAGTSHQPASSSASF